MAMVKHMAYRNDLLPEEARKAVRGYGLSLKLYLPEAPPRIRTSASMRC